MEPGTPVSPYRVGHWTVTRLKDELRQRNLSPVGNKAELIARLEHAETDTEGASPSKGRVRQGSLERRAGRSASRSPVREANLASPERASSRADHYQKMSTNQLKEELRERGLSPYGKRQELTDRLNDADLIHGSPFVEIVPPLPESEHLRRRSRPKKGERRASISPSPVRRSPPRPSVSKSPALGGRHSKSVGKLHSHDISLLRSPFLTLRLFAKFCWATLQSSSSHVKKNPLPWISALLAGLLVFAASAIPGKHHIYLAPIKEAGLWYGRWLLLGVLSSVGLGTGAHTFLLFLGPLIARVTTVANSCRSLNFAIAGARAFVCTRNEPHPAITLVTIFDKVKWEAFAWGAGTALGELPPYLIARASALTGRSSGEMVGINQLLSKPRKQRTWIESAQVASFHVVGKLGFLGILLCASIPNPLFDLAGLSCGYFAIPFWTFASATFIGKAIIKAAIQSIFVIFLFSKDYLDMFAKAVQVRFPTMGPKVSRWLVSQKTVFAQSHVDETTTLVQTLFQLGIFLMMSYFVLSVVRSAAVLQAKREGRLAK